MGDVLYVQFGNGKTRASTPGSIRNNLTKGESMFATEYNGSACQPGTYDDVYAGRGVSFEEVRSSLSGRGRGILGERTGLRTDCPICDDPKRWTLVVTDDQGTARFECENGCDGLAEWFATPPAPRRKRSAARPCVAPAARVEASSPSSLTVSAPVGESAQEVNAVLDTDPDPDPSQKPIDTGYSALADDGLPPSHLGALIRRYKDGTLQIDPDLRVQLTMPRGSAQRSLAEWFRTSFELRLAIGETEPMGFSVSLAASLLGWNPRNRGDLANASRAIHRLEAQGVIECVGTVPVPAAERRFGEKAREMRCFLPVGVDLEALLEGEQELALVDARAA